jgi:hypothetical protein
MIPAITNEVRPASLALVAGQTGRDGADGD